MKKASLIINRNYTAGAAEKAIFSSFIEHMGRAVYGGIYDPQHETANGDGFRTDIIGAIRELGVDKIRYPGGNFVSGYDWKDGIGARGQRPTRLNHAWQQTETNEVGIDEFMRFLKETGCEPIMAVNLGTGTPAAAAELVEYCNLDTDTVWAETRRRNGVKKPYKIKNWCLGNEMDGEWQIGHRSADEYGRLATEAAKLMRWTDPDISLVLCGSSSSAMPTYPEWDRVVLEHAYEYVDYISLHKYYEFPDRDKSKVSDFLASYLDFDSFISAIASTIEYVKCKKRSKRSVKLSVDEWNVWHTGLRKPDAEKWALSTAREENTYTMLDTLVFSTLICTLLNHAEHVKVACLAQLINVLAPIMTDTKGRMLKQSIFYPFMLASKYCTGTVMNTVMECASFDSVYGAAQEICTSAVLDAEGILTLMAVSLTDQDTALNLNFERFGTPKLFEHTYLHADNLTTANTFDTPSNILPKTLPTPSSTDSILLKAHSVNFLRFRID